MSGEVQNLRSLTGLRFFAAAGVVWFHGAIWATREGEPQAWFWSWARFGSAGVTFFFVLSGFVLVWSAAEGDTVRRFYQRRFARVWPVHALTWAAALVLVPFGMINAGALSGALNLALLQTWSNNPDIIWSFNSVSWSLSNEAFFYAIFPLLLVLVRRVKPALTITLAVGWLLLGGLIANRLLANWVYVFPVYRVAEFVIGMALALLVQRGLKFRVPAAAAVASLVLTYAALVALDQQTGAVTARGWVLGLGLLPAIVLTIVALAQNDLAGREGWLTRPLWVKLGQWSFALYMVHDLLLKSARPLMLDHPWTVPLVLVAAVGLAGAVYEWFEAPIEKRIRPSRARPAAQLEHAE